MTAAIPAAIALTIECSYKMSSANRYTCIDVNVNIDKNELNIDGSDGKHLKGKSNENVQEIFLISPAMHFLPRNLTMVFPKLKSYNVQGNYLGDRSQVFDEPDPEDEDNSEDDIEEKTRALNPLALINGDFHNSGNILWIFITSANLQDIRPNVFEGASSLMRLTLDDNLITSLHKNAFQSIPKLARLYLRNNFIQTLHNDTFKPLPNLRRLYLSGNYIKKIYNVHFGSRICQIGLSFNMLEVVEVGLVDNLKAIRFVGLENNVCVNKNFFFRDTKVSEFRKQVRNCIEEDLSPKKQIKKLKVKIFNLNAEVKVLKRSVASSNKEIDKLSRSLLDCENDSEELKKHIQDREQKIFLLTKDIKTLEMQIDKLLGELAAFKPDKPASGGSETVDPLKKQVKSLQKKLKQKSVELKRLQKNLDEQVKITVDCERKNKELSAEITTLKKKKQELQHQLDQCNEENCSM